MKILFVLHLPPPVHGAAAVGLQIKNSTIVNEAFSCEYINLGTSVTIEEIGKRRAVKLLRYFAILWRVLKTTLFHRPDLCYFSMTSKCTPFYKDASLALLVKLLGVKIVYHFHNKGVSANEDRIIDNLLYRLVFKGSQVILLSPNLYPDIQKYVKAEHVYYCPNGIAEVSSVSGVADDSESIRLLFLSNLMESKGVYLLLEACRMLRQKQLAFQCTFVGGVGDIDKQRFESKLEELQLEDCVHYVGEKFGREKGDFFLNADIFVHPTLNDCFPLVLLEAMQYSLPVISTFEGGIPDIVDDGLTGFLIPRNDAQALADKLELLIDNADLRLKMGVAAYHKFNNEFKSDKFEVRITQILRHLLENS
jgi:glycosyltransferase involved in cell wall biosynthesis